MLVTWACFLYIAAYVAASSELLRRNVTATSKAGLAWSNGNTANYKQYTTTGKVSWYDNLSNIINERLKL